MDGIDYVGALKCLHEVAHKVLDRLVLLTLQAECELQVGEKTAAANTFKELLKINPNCPDALKGYAKAVASFPFDSDFRDRSLTKAQRKELLGILDDLEKSIESRNLPRQCLDLAEGADLRKRIDNFARPYVRSNIPSLFSALKSLYSNPEAVPVVEALFLEWKDELTKHNKFVTDDAPNPTCLLWVLIYLSMHYIKLGNFQSAKQYVEEAIVHSPTVEKLYSIRAKILKHEGKAVEAAAEADTARKLDLADRYLTNRCVKYMLRANQLNEAERTYATFSRAKEGEVLSNIVDLQCMWFELELAESYYRQGDLRSALQTFLLVDHHFNDFKEDQFDFHSYCLRKYTLRAYTDMLKFHDDSLKHPTYLAAARRVVRIYLDIANINNADAVTANVIDHAKKVNAQAECALGKVPSLTNPLVDCMPFLQALLKYASNDLTTASLATEAYLKKGKTILALKSALAGAKLQGAKNDKVFVALVKSLAALTPTDDAVKNVLSEFRAVPEVKSILS
jgi:peptide alpha-N-acetyltransferase